MKIKFYLILVILLGLIQMINCVNKKQKKTDSFKIIFWSNKSESMDDDKIEEKYQLSYEDIIKIEPSFILTSKYIKKYYWDEQFLIVDWDELVIDGYSSCAFGYYTIVFKEKIIYHGYEHTDIFAKVFPRDNSPYPAIQLDSNNEDVTFFILKPRFLDINMTFKDYDKKEREKILNDGILKYFEKQGKIVRGYFDISELEN